MGTLFLGGCNQQPQQAPAAAPAAASTAPSTAPASSAAPASAYTPPTADQLYQLVAPIALFPDKLVAQVLAGSTYPDQITAADNLLAQNPNLKGTLLQAAVDPQPWDPSVKGLTAFPSTLDQMAKNVQWTTALGEAYVNDPTDVLNAIQVMRQRASTHGNLRSTQQQRVETRVVEAAAPASATYVEDSGYQPVYSGPSVVPAPEQVIEIEPTQPDTVYVPSYDPQAVYGGDVGYYPSYTYERPSYSGSDLVAVGAVTFGVAILVSAMHDHYHDGGGWHSWGMNWGGGRGGNDGGGGGGWHRPAVVYNNQTYVSRSTTVVNRYTTNNITNINSNNRTVTNNNGNIVNNRNTINNINNSVNNSNNNSHNQIAQNREVTNHVDNRQFDHRNVPNASAPAAAPAQPNHMTMPNFSQARQPAAANNAHPAAPHAAVPQPHEAQPRVDERHAPAPRPQEAFHQPTNVTHPPQPQPTQMPHSAPAPHPTMPQPRPAERMQAPHQQPEQHTQPAPHPQPAPQPQHQQPAPRPQPEARPQPEPRPQPEARPAPEHQNPQPHPAPQQNHPQKAPPPHPEKKDDKDHH